MRVPYKGTQFLRATVKREVRCVLDVEADAPEGSYRLVQVIAPDAVYVTTDPSAGLPENVSGGRDYMMALVPNVAGVVAPFPLLPNERLYMLAASNAGSDKQALVFAALIVQFWTPKA